MGKRQNTSPAPSAKIENLQTRRDELQEQFQYLLRAFEKQYDEVAVEVRRLTAREIPGAKRVSQRLASRLGTFHKEIHSRLRIFWEIARNLLEAQHKGDMQTAAAEFRQALDDFETKYGMK